MCCLCEQGRGASRQALLKYMMQNFKLGQDEKAVNSHLKLALKSGLEKGLLVQSTGKGVTGSVKLNKKGVGAGPAKAATAKKPKAVKKPKATHAKAAKKTLKKPKKVSLGTAKAKKPSLTKKSTSKVLAKPKVGPKKSAAAKPKATKAKLKPKVTKAAVGKGKKHASKK